MESFEKSFDPALRPAAARLRAAKKTADRERTGAVEVNYSILDSDLRSFAASFEDVLPADAEGGTAEMRFRTYIETALSRESPGPRCAIEFGGPGSRLFKGFTKGFFTRTIGVCLNDQRPSFTIAKGARIGGVEPYSLSHAVIEGDILRNDTYKKVAEELDGHPVNLIISRMAGGLRNIPSDPIIFGKLIKKWYELLSENGIMFVQYQNILGKGDPGRNHGNLFLDSVESLVRAWASLIQEQYPDTLAVQPARATFRLEKKKGAPKELPWRSS